MGNRMKRNTQSKKKKEGDEKHRKEKTSRKHRITL